MFRSRHKTDTTDAPAPATQPHRVPHNAARPPVWADARGAVPPAGLIVQAKPTDPQAVEPTTTPDAEPTAPMGEPTAVAPSATTWLVDDDAPGPLAPEQMRKSAFLEQLRASVTASADQALAGTIWSSVGCPYIEQWFAYYSDRDSAHIERALRRYVPAAATTTNAHAYIPLICARVNSAIATWADTGTLQGIPDIAAASPTPAPSPILAKTFAGVTPTSATPPNGPDALSSGRPLDGGARTRMESAFGADFSDVRIHADPNAARAAGTLQARAFTIGRDVAFGAGEYQPGTPIGDALLAHELAHVLQQRDASPGTLQPSGAEYRALEQDADQSASSVLVGLWGGATGALRTIASTIMPTLRTGLRLQSCGKSVEEKNAAVLKLSGLVGNPQDNETAVIAEIDALGGDAAEVLMRISPFSAKSSDSMLNVLAGSEAGQRILVRASTALRDGDLVAKMRADTIDNILKARQTPSTTIIKPDEQKAIDRINKAIDADPRKTTYTSAKLPLRFPVTRYDSDKEMTGGVYYNPYLPTTSGEAGRTKAAAWSDKTHDTMYPLIAIQLGPLALSETDEYIRSILWHEFQHYLQYLRYREPSAGKTPETKILEAESNASAASSPNAELEATSIQIADDMTKLNDKELTSVLRYLATFTTNPKSNAGFVTAAIERIKKAVTGDRTKQDRLLNLIAKLNATERTQLNALTTAIRADLAPLPPKPKGKK